MMQPVYCTCGRYMGAYIGKAQCPSCRKWIMVLPKVVAIAPVPVG